MGHWGMTAETLGHCGECDWQPSGIGAETHSGSEPAVHSRSAIAPGLLGADFIVTIIIVTCCIIMHSDDIRPATRQADG